MDGGFPNLGFAGNYSSNAFKILANSMQVGGSRTEHPADTSLRLSSVGSPNISMLESKGIKRKWSLIDGSAGEDIDSSLSLGLGLSSSSSDSKGSSTTAYTTMSSAKEIDEESSLDTELDLTLHLGNEKSTSAPKPSNSLIKGMHLGQKLDLGLSLSTGPPESDVTVISQPNPIEVGASASVELAASADEESSPWKHLKMPPPSKNPSNAPKDCKTATPASSAMTTPKSSVTITCTSGITQPQSSHNRSSNTKLCQVEGCPKGARGASGRCISHGGGRRCQKPGCQKGAEGRTVFCKAHGGGRRCEYLGCTKSAEGRTDYCIAHGGGRRCNHEGCIRAARGKSGLCIRHGGGKRCQRENCTRSAEGLSGLCISHGGGRRCQYVGCAKGAQGSTMFCKAHGGGKRCTYPGCTKGAEGSTAFCKGHGGGKRCAFQGGGVCTKSVHGGTNFCVTHGGGKRCAVSGCTKSARGRTDFCVRHGGGKRCKFEGCGKSAQGSTDFCKAHGGGKRCLWGHPGTDYANQPPGPCNSFARGKTGLCALHGGLVQDKRVHGGITLGTVIQVPPPGELEKMKEAATAEDMNIDIVNLTGSSHGKSYYDFKKFQLQTHSHVGDVAVLSPSVFVPEGRVHGGSLMAMLAASSSEPNEYHMMSETQV